ncbi:hypothetical protein MASR1M50_28820 [Burkholderiales bacterium]
MVQRLEHQRQVEPRLRQRNGFGAGSDERQALGRGSQVLGVLDGVDLQPGHSRVGVARQQIARQPRAAAAQLDDVLVGQWQQFGQDGQFVAFDPRAHVHDGSLHR